MNNKTDKNTTTVCGNKSINNRNYEIIDNNQNNSNNDNNNINNNNNNQ